VTISKAGRNFPSQQTNTTQGPAATQHTQTAQQVPLKTDTTPKRPVDVMDRGVRNAEHKMEVVCPVLASLVKEGRITMDGKGNINLKQLRDVMVNQMGVSRTMAAALMGTGVFANKPSDILNNLFNMSMNIKELRGGIIKHPSDSAILTRGKFDEKKFNELTSHAKDGRMTLASFGEAIKAQAGRDANPATLVKDVIPTSLGPLLPDGFDAYVRGVPSAMVEFAAVTNIYGKQDPKTGERYIDVGTLRDLYEKKQLPPDSVMQNRPSTGMADLTTTMAQMGWQMAFGSAAGEATQSANKVLGNNVKGGDSIAGAGKVTCPFMAGGGGVQKPNSERELANAHMVQ
jgi:hypothetical protein